MADRPQLLNCQTQSHLSWLVVSPLRQECTLVTIPVVILATFRHPLHCQKLSFSSHLCPCPSLHYHKPPFSALRTNTGWDYHVGKLLAGSKHERQAASGLRTLNAFFHQLCRTRTLLWSHHTQFLSRRHFLERQCFCLHYCSTWPLPMHFRIPCLLDRVLFTGFLLGGRGWGGGGGGIRPPLKTFCPPLENSKIQF